MEASSEIIIDGHRVICRVSRQGDRGYTVAIGTSRQGQQGAAEPLAWRPVATQRFDSKEDAERHARYVLLGVCSVGQDGEPVLSVT